MSPMTIGGFQPLSLVDYPGKTCAIVFTQGCPFRCPYCHNPELIPVHPAGGSERSGVALARHSGIPDTNDILEYIAAHKSMLDGVCITGGEPTIQVGLLPFLKQIKDLGLLVKLDTNGIHPKVVTRAIEEGVVDYFAMDLKHRWEKYQEIVRSGGEKVVELCRRTFGLIQSSGIPHEFRTTVAPGIHGIDDFFEMVSYLKDGESYFIQETAFTKTLDPALSRHTGFFVPDLAADLQAAFPRCHIQVR
ncbi:anaerobic ribonucleoside-triphosphate reductase activating protein [Candidatus Uhrbacteria bacterium]|nr:anaerobic ribonucleoside-triphosphate reductase activating protein [Candidatus Uhrbacteria bacterium]